jgi:hypothetical protein
MAFIVKVLVTAVPFSVTEGELPAKLKPLTVTVSPSRTGYQPRAERSNVEGFD